MECSFNESLDSSCGNIKSPWRSVMTKRDDLSHFTSHVIDFLTDLLINDKVNVYDSVTIILWTFQTVILRAKGSKYSL